MTSKHTPGPWRVHRHHKPISDQWVFTVTTDDEYGDVIASTCTSPQRPESVRMADSTLIALAPEMLEVLEQLEERCDDSDGGCYGGLSTAFVRAMVRPLIARARGES